MSTCMWLTTERTDGSSPQHSCQTQHSPARATSVFPPRGLSDLYCSSESFLEEAWCQERLTLESSAWQTHIGCGGRDA